MMLAKIPDLIGVTGNQIMAHWLIILLLGAMVTSPTLLLAQSTDQSGTTVTESADDADGSDVTLTLNFQDADIRALINTVSQVTGKNFVVDPRVKGKVTLVSGEKLTAMQIYEVFLSVLEVHNFAAVPSGGVIKILPANIIKQSPTPIQFGEGAPAVDEQITQVYQLRHTSVQELVPILRPLLPPTSHFAAHAPTNTLVFTDTGANIRRVLEIIKRVDKPEVTSDVHVVYLTHARATNMAQILSKLSAGLPAPGGAARSPNPAQQISIQAEESLNAVIIQSPESEFQLLKAVIDQLDIERPEGGGDIHVIYLKYAKATDLVNILNQVVTENGAAAAEGQPLATKVSVQASEEGNALVIRADEEQFHEIESVVDQLDRRRAQVFVETIIAEVSETKAADLGVTWTGRTESSPTRGEVTASTSFSDSSGGIEINVLDTYVTDFLGNVVPNLQVILHALRSDANTNILSTPNLLTLDNETAEIIVGQEVPFVTGQFTSNVATGGTTDADGNISPVVNPFQTIERKDVGLTLRITPQINEGDTIQLEFEQEISSVSSQPVAGASDLITDNRSISATVQVEDGQIIVLGGLIRDDLVDSIEWVPILGELPLIGSLFRKKTKRAVKTNLMVFLRPKVVRTPADLVDITRSRYQFIQQQERASQPKTERLIPEASRPVLDDHNWNDGPQK